jgi:hypothetical protein
MNRNPEFIELPAQFGSVWINRHRVDSVLIKYAGTAGKALVRIRIRDQHIDTDMLDVDLAKTVRDKVLDLVTGQ